MSQYEMQKTVRELKRANMGIVYKVLSVLHEGGEKKTNIAMKCGMSYDRCVSYLNWLDLFGYVRKREDEKGFEILGLSEGGMTYYSRLQSSKNKSRN